MKAVFVYDGPIQIDLEGNFYSPVINNKVFNRYLNHADELSVAIRVEPFKFGEMPNETNRIKMDRIRVTPVPSLSSVYGAIFCRNNAHKILKEQIALADFAIIRLPSFIGAEAVRIARRMKKPYLVEVVGCPWDSLWNYGIKGKIIAPSLTFSMKKHVKNAEYVIYVTKHFLQERYPTKGKSTNCSNVEIVNVHENVLNKRIDHIANKDGDIIIGTAAAVNVPYKGQQYIIRALGELKKKGITNYRYQLAGGGDRSRLESIIRECNVEDQVEFIGVLTHEQIFEWLDSIDIYAQPSRQEGLPRALIEAMSRGLPAIGAKTGGIPELLNSEFIFSNTSKNVDEICQLLTNFSKEKMLTEAKRNFQESIQYKITNIEKRRNEMLDMILSVVD